MTSAAVEATDLAELAGFLPRAYRLHHPVAVAHSTGALVTTIDGQALIDFAGGVGVLNVGQRHPRVVAALREQIDRLLHIGPVAAHPGYLRLAARLARAAPGGGDQQVLLLNSGAEAVENAVKVARHATGRTAVIAFDRSFHGRTLLTSTLSGRAHPYKSQPGSGAPDVFHAPFPYPYRPPPGVAADQLSAYCLDALDRLVENQVPASRVAAVVVEPIQGEGGYIVPSPGFLPAVAQWCRRIGALLIVDEIQSGFGRTGRLFASEHEALEPDLLVVGKSIAAGLPLAGVVADRDVFDTVPTAHLGGTFGGNPLACAAALAVLDVLAEPGVLAEATASGERALAVLRECAARLPIVGDVRGRGLMLAVELVSDPATRTPAPELADRFVTSARENGLLTIRTGTYGNVVRLLPPVVIDRPLLDRGLDIFAETLAQLAAGSTSTTGPATTGTP